MSNNYYGVGASILLIGLILVLSTLFQKKLGLSEELTRKFVHISVANYWWLAMIFFKTSLWASLVPILFVIINYLSYRFSLFKAMERSDKAKNSLGTVYYPLSLTILTLVTFSSISSPYVGALGMMSMGYGDGLAGLIGSQWGQQTLPVFNRQKTVLGTATMFFVTLIVITSILYSVERRNFFWISLFLASIGTIIELISPKGLDNLSLPLSISFLYQLLFY